MHPDDHGDANDPRYDVPIPRPPKRQPQPCAGAILQGTGILPSDARERAVEIGQQLIRALPDIAKVDVKPVLPGGRVLKVDGHEYASSGLLRRYDHHPGAVGWNQERALLAQTLFGASETERLNEASGLLAEAAHLVRDFGNVFVRSFGPSAQATELFERLNALNARGRDLPPRLGASPFSGGDQAEIG